MNTLIYQDRDQQKKASSLKLFLMIYVVVFIILAIVFHIMNGIIKDEDVGDKKIEEEFTNRLQYEKVCRSFDNIVNDIRILQNQNEMKALLEKNSPLHQSALAAEFLNFVTERRIYDQIRFLDVNGMEVVRVNYRNGNPVIVPSHQLQSKANRYYFTDTIGLNNGQIFVSPMDLNVENGKVEEPFKPMIRFGIPLFDKNGEKKGSLIINFMGQRVIDDLRRISKTAYGSLLLVNQDQYFMTSHIQEDEWGFMFEDKKNRTFNTVFPNTWDHIKANREGQFETSDGLFTFKTAYPINLSSGLSSCSLMETKSTDLFVSSKNRFWKIISFIPDNKLHAHGYFYIPLWLAIAIYILSAIPAYIIAVLMVKKSALRDDLIYSANFDGLTGLPNRSLFYDRIHQTFSYSLRYENHFAVLFIDLDDFKVVNDTLGHEAGDELLQKVAERLTTIVRSSDTIARFGGDEFIMILNNVRENIGVEKVANILINEIKKPYDIKGNEVIIGSSIGVAIFPDDGSSVESLISKADDAMYQAKSRGKNQYVMA